MALPMLIHGLFLAGGFVAGALSRQPEINRLRAQVVTLQAQISELQSIIQEQHRQIVELNVRYKALKAWSFVEKNKVASERNAYISNLCMFKEYCGWLCAMANGRSIGKREKVFFRIYEMFMSGRDESVSDDDLDSFSEYIEDKYSVCFDSGTPPSLDGEVLEIEVYSK